jgi:outer membrane translocation and assembly module TamA
MAMLTVHDITDVIGKWNFAGDLEVNTPLIYEYYGRNNRLIDVMPDIVQMNNFVYEPSLRLHSKTLSQFIDLRLKGQHVNFEQTTKTHLTDDELKSQSIIGAGAKYLLADLDNKLNPHHGIQISGEVVWQKSVRSNAINYVFVKPELRLFFPLIFMPRQTTVGFRTGFQTNLGSASFFQANFLNGFENFRGIARNRFAGKTISYNNLDVRVSLFKVPNKIIPFDFGILAHVDAAKSWQEDGANLWHTSYGGGGFIKVLDFLMLVGTVSVSESDQTFVFGTKFFF